MWTRKADSFAAFLMDMIDEHPDGVIKKLDLKIIYKRYCTKHDLKMTNDKGIYQVLSKDMAVGVHKNNEDDQNYWVGIRIKEGILLDIKT